MRMNTYYLRGSLVLVKLASVSLTKCNICCRSAVCSLSICGQSCDVARRVSLEYCRDILSDPRTLVRVPSGCTKFLTKMLVVDNDS